MKKMRLSIARLEYALRFRLSCCQKKLWLKNYLVLTPKKPVAPHFFQKMGGSCGATQNLFSMYLPHCICYLCAKFQVVTMISLGGVIKQTNKQTNTQTFVLYYMYRYRFWTIGKADTEETQRYERANYTSSTLPEMLDQSFNKKTFEIL